MLRGTRRAALVLTLFLLPAAVAQDWPRFRGPNGSGVVQSTRPLPTTWSSSQNLKWQVKIPGPGSSSPIVVGDRIFVTYWSGYGVEAGNPGKQEDLKRHLLCLDKATGATLWDRSCDASLPEDRFGGMFAQHGYATHTPVSDGAMVYAFFGKSGVLAYDIEGAEQWRVDVGDGLDGRGWGSASSPILYRDLLIVPAVVESRRLLALNKKTGAIVWEQQADGFASRWSTPVIVTNASGVDELVMAVPHELWAFEPNTGKLLWYCETPQENSAKASAITAGDVVFVIEGRQGGAIAIRSGGEKDVSQSKVLWRGRKSGQIGTPLIHEGKIYWISNGLADCIDAATGEEIFHQRLQPPALAGREPESPAAISTVAAQSPRGGRGGPREGGGRFGPRGRGGFGGGDYSSPVAADGKLYYVTRRGTVYVLKVGEAFQQLASNTLDLLPGEDFSATPAISDGALFIRSSARLFCVAVEK